jgi:hypothetical protein
MASLAEHLSGPLTEAAPAVPAPTTHSVVPSGLFYASLTLFVFSCSVLAYTLSLDRR